MKPTTAPLHRGRVSSLLLFSFLRKELEGISFQGRNLGRNRKEFGKEFGKEFWEAIWMEYYFCKFIIIIIRYLSNNY